MSDPLHTLFDGDHETPFLVAPPLVWEDEVLRCTMTKLRFRVRAPFFRFQTRGSINSRANGRLVGQPPPKIVAGDLLEYERIYATQPQRPKEPVPTVYPYQIVNTGGTSGPELAELPIPVTALAEYRYYHTADPTSIPLATAWKIVELSGSIVGVGTKPGKSPRTLLAEDESITRVFPGGDYWEVRRLTVSIRSLIAAT